MRGDTSDRLVDDGPLSDVDGLVARASSALGGPPTVVQAQQLVAELRRCPGVRAAGLVVAPVAADRPNVLRLAIGADEWHAALRVEFADRTAYHRVAPAAREIAAAADRALSRPCLPAAPPLGTVPALYEAVATGARPVIVVIDPATGWTPLSDTLTAVLGYDRNAPPPGRLIDLVHLDDRPAAVAAFLTCCAGEEPPAPVDLRVRTAAGRWRTLEAVARGFVHEERAVVVAFFAVDVTGQREAERAALVQHSRVVKLVDSIRDGLVMLDRSGRLRVINDAAREMLDLAEPTGDWQALLLRLAGRLRDAGTVVPRLGENVDADRPVIGEEIAFDDGRVLEMDFVPVDEDGQPYGTLVHVRDVTERVATRRGLEDRSRGLEERLRALAEATALNNEFVASVAHELRGPLSSVVAFSHLLGDAGSGDLNDDQRMYLDVIDRNANRLLRLIEDLLLLSRLEARTLHLRPAPIRLPELLSAAVDERRVGAAAAGVILELDVPDGPEVVCDDTRIHQVIDNLVSNAVKFTAPGGRVTVRGRPTVTGWTVEIMDTGVGIPPADLPRLFSAFFRGSNVVSPVGRQVTPGTGLGLVVSRAIVELHGGTIQVASTEGVGTTVSLSLPLRPPATRSEPASPAAAASSHQPRNGGTS